MAKQRLQKVLAAAGAGSRRKCEELILSGAVEVNSKAVNELPAFVDPKEDIITVSGQKIRQEKKVYFLLNKPKAVLCTSSDPLGRKKAIDFIPSRQRLFCVGRLDADTTGVIILTNDSELANKLTHPRYAVPKTYVARVKGQVRGVMVEKLKKGIWLADPPAQSIQCRKRHLRRTVRRAGGKTSRASVKVLKHDHKESLIEITVRQGLNRQVRRMLAKVGLPVKSLRRTRIGNLTAQGVPIGKFRELTKAEIAYLKKDKLKAK
jgi:23S rRNA pseudouridine2605 synthase